MNDMTGCWEIAAGPSRRASEATSTVSKRKNAKTACDNCKRRKLKCYGGIPCVPCTKNGAACRLNENTDQRRKHVLKRKLSTMEEKGVLLDDLILYLQETDETCSDQILSLVRSHATLEEIREHLDNVVHRIESQSPEVMSAIEDFHSFEEEQRGASRRRVEESEGPILIFQVPAAPWTTVTSNDDFVSHLMSLWFTWAHPYLNWIDRDLFIRDMRSGDIEAKFCSPFLVNVILADACAYLDDPEVYGFENEDCGGLHFYQEAKRLLGEQEGKINLVNVQALCGLYVVSCMIGKDRTGWLYYGQLAYATQELSRKHQAQRDAADEDEIEEIRAIDNAMWGIFNLASLTALAYQKGALISPPRRRHIPAECHEYQDDWHAYPFSELSVPSHRACLFTALCDMGEITYELSLSLFRDSRETLDMEFAQLAESLYDRLRAWYEELPNCLSSIEATPHVTSLHLNYHTTIQTLFGRLKGLPTSEGASEDERAELETIKKRAHSRCIDSARLTADLVDQQREAWGLEYMLASNIHWFSVSMYTLLDGLSDEDNQEAFVALSIAAKAASHRWVLARGMLRLVQLTAIQMGVELPPETEALFSDFEARVWTHQDRKALSSQYPHFSHSMKRGEVNEYELDSFLDKFDDLQVTRKSDSTERDGGQGWEEASSDEVEQD